MFHKKQNSLGEGPVQANTKGTQQGVFVNAGLMEKKREAAKTLSGNGALKYSITGNEFVDQFGKVGQYREPRTYDSIAEDCEKLWKINPTLTVAFILYVRMITRVVQFFNGLTTKVSQKGAELKHEGIFRMIWLHTHAPETFWKNISLFISVGSWRDIIIMLQYDLVWNGWNGRVLNWNKFGELVLSGLENKNTSNLIKKYLPQIKAKSKCKTIESQADNLISKWLCSLLFGTKEDGTTYKRYRKLKTSGTAHEWQKLISQRQFDRIDFNTIHGRALNLLVRSKFLKNSGLSEAYAKWIVKPETVVKYVGFVHELFKGVSPNMPKHEEDTINKQFMTLVDKAGESGNPGLIVVRDTSGSMNATADGLNMSSGDVAKAIALYMSYFLKGQFKDAWIEFCNKAEMRVWEGNSPLSRWFNDKSNYVGNTNFQSVIDLLCNIKSQGVKESDFPRGILCISDGEFNPVQLGLTNVQLALSKLTNAGFSPEYVSNFVIALWNIPNAYYGNSSVKFETFGNVPNVFYMSGYSASIVSFLSSEIKTAEELMQIALSQEVMQMIEL